MNQKTHSEGFTLIELLVVLTILTMLAGLIGPQIIRQFGSAKSDTARLQMENLAAALDLFYLGNNRYPTTEEGLEALVKRPSGLTSWNGPYLKGKKIPTDPWGHDYQYQSPGSKSDYELLTFGADNRPGGDGKNEDINSWE